MANAFTELFDGDWKRTKSSLRARTANEGQAYDPTYSWDARTDNPAAFSKMESTDVPVQFARPVTLSGQQIIPLEPLSGQFLNVDAPSKLKGLNHIPLSHDQTDVGMHEDIHGTIPIHEQATKEGKFVTIKERPVFSKSQNQPPKFQMEEKPDFMDKAGPQGDQILLNPTQRRAIIEFEKRARSTCYHEKCFSKRGRKQRK